MSPGYVLGISVSTELASIARVNVADERPVQHTQIQGHRQHGEQLLPSLMAMTDPQQPPLAIAVDMGPGGFTGIRTACAMAQGLAIGWQRPCRGWHSLHLMAGSDIPATMSRSRLVGAVLDARAGEVYMAWYALTGDMSVEGAWLSAPPVELIPPHVMSLDQDLHQPELQARWQVLLPYAESVVLVYGSQGRQLEALSAMAHRLHAAWSCFRDIPSIPIHQAEPDALIAARWTADLLAREALIKSPNPDLVQPCYVRERVAQTIAERLTR